MKSKLAKISTRMKVLSAVAGIVLAGVGAYAATNWVVGLSAGSSGEGQSATISNLNITAVATPSATNLLYPGGTGDVVVTISNPNPYPVTITASAAPHEHHLRDRVHDERLDDDTDGVPGGDAQHGSRGTTPPAPVGAPIRSPRH